MVRSSTASCFKLITCGGDNNDSVDRDDLGAPESKGSSDRSRWSFRKRSARHRVLSNSVTSEMPSGIKASPDSATVSFQTQASSTIPEKNSVVQWAEEKNQVQVPLDSKLSETIAAAEEKNPVQVHVDSKLLETIAADEDDNRAGSVPDEAVVIIIQSAIRRFLAQRILLKHKSIIKLQAAVRGHIVRRHAVGSLRCVQALVKMQMLVRERRARLLTKGSGIVNKLDEKNGNDNRGSHMGKENRETKPYSYTSIEKLLSNAFARQLLESTPKTKTINIKCDPSKSDSAWKWLERWMSVLSVESGQPQKFGLAAEQHDRENIEESDCKLETVISSPENCQSRDIKSSIEALPVPSEADENVITYDADSYDFQECRPTLSSLSNSLEQTHPRSIAEANSINSTLDSLPGHSTESDLVSKIEPDSFPDHSEMEHGQHIDILEAPGSKVSETNGTKSSIGSRKACNPAFVAAQSKFEELSSAANLGKSVGSSNQDASIDSSLDAVLPVINHAFGTTEICHAESSFSKPSAVQVGGSECETELSISSTLDSPDRSEVGVVDFEKETESIEDSIHNSKNLNVEVDEKVESIFLERELSNSNSSQPEVHGSSTAANSEHLGSMVAVDSFEAEQKPDSTPTDVHVELVSETSHPVSKSSPEASPRSHVTIPESQGTPSSQVSVKPKKIRSGKHRSNHKRGSVPTGKESHLETNQDNGASSSEHTSKEHKTGKRRNSFGSARPDHGDQEPRDSSSSNSLPSYMQATESARAKALANSSPRSSPDVQDKDFHIKKRQSIPGTNTGQGSPRVQQSMAQAQQGAKGNGTHSPQERKWRR
ncbi:hypothetical protein ACH5RR_035215 [Cinchona calisaya]|uniref:DUF4005 domain-containing protein n=1 Tax=Cinchona calisaya TaxID=153742 RepID=A0ABD2YH75_9GENT